MLKINDGLNDAQRYRRRHKELGLCSHCSNPAVEGKTRCAVCDDRMKSYRIERRKIQQSAMRLHQVIQKARAKMTPDEKSIADANAEVILAQAAQKARQLRRKA